MQAHATDQWMEQLMDRGAREQARLHAQQNPRVVNALNQFSLTIQRQTGEIVQAWADRVLAVVVANTKAIQATLYLRGEDALRVTLAGSYAASDDTQLHIDFGEGLAGQVLADGNSLLVPLASDGRKVGIAMGAIQAQHLLLQPLLNQGLAEGLLEITYITAPDSDWRIFLEDCCTRIAQQWTAVRFQETLAQVQQHAQEQASRLHHQEYELRALRAEVTKAEAETARTLAIAAESERHAHQMEAELNTTEAELLAYRQQVVELRRALSLAHVFSAAA